MGAISVPDGDLQSATPSLNSFGQIGGYFNGNWSLWTPAEANGTTGSITSSSQWQGLTNVNSMGQAILSQYGQPMLFTPTTAHGSTGTLTVIPALAGASEHHLQAINDKGTVAGYSCVIQPAGGCQNRAFLWMPATSTAPSRHRGSPCQGPSL